MFSLGVRTPWIKLESGGIFCLVKFSGISTIALGK